MFDKIFCINLDERKDRWEESKEEFKRLGWKVDRFPGVVNHFNKAQYDCIKKASQYKSSLILEDDVQFEGVGHLEEALKSLPDDWDLVSFGATLSSRHVEQVSKHLFRYKDGWATQAVGYSQKMMKYILENFKIDGGTIYDEWLRLEVLPKFNCYIVVPMVAYQRPSFSDLRNRFVDYTNGFNQSQNMFK